MKVLHVASFEGNLGDNANIDSLHAALAAELGPEPVTRLEIREFHWRQRSFDAGFAALANAHDLVIIGGGNYFEVWVERSCSGMTVDIPYPVLESIRTPILFYGLGFDPWMGYSEATLQRSRQYFDYLLARPERYLVTVRNDGSRDSLTRLHGTDIAGRIAEVPDGGFLLQVPPQPQPWLQADTPCLAINLAGDMLELRHPGGELLDADGFCREFAAAVAAICARQPDLAVVFVPHIYRDLGLIARVFDELPDPLRRRRLYVAPYTHGSGPHHAIFDLYRRAACSLGVRLHANICPIALGTPTLGLVNYPQIAALYAGLGIPERAFSIREPGFAPALADRVDALLAGAATARAENAGIAAAIGQRFAAFLTRFRTWYRP